MNFARILTKISVDISGGALLLLAGLICGGSAPLQGAGLSSQSQPALIPHPEECSWQNTEFTVGRNPTVFCTGTNGATLQREKDALENLLCSQGVKPQQSPQGTRGSFELAVDSTTIPQPEGYALNVSRDGVQIVGHDAAGVFYGIQTLRQLISSNRNRITIPGVNIRDWPAFGARGFMHDVGRNFQTIEDLKPQIDVFAAYKLNLFHLHLTDSPGWRLQSRRFPKLNDPESYQPLRDVGKFYTFDQLRELIAYGRRRHVRILPEFDMPGHSDYFERAFGVRMESPLGREILEGLLQEFCDEIPAADCPEIHLGSDEARIQNAADFMERMARKLQTLERTVVVWSPGIHFDAPHIEQVWNDKFDTKHPFIDSLNAGYNGYLNTAEPLATVQHYFFYQPCHQPAGNSRALGAILCCWPDVRVADKQNIFRHSAVWPGLLAFSEAVWCGRATNQPGWLYNLPPKNSDALKAFAEFESRVAAHRDRFFAGKPFPFVKLSQLSWRVVGPFWHEAPAEMPLGPELEMTNRYSNSGRSLEWSDMQGGILFFTNSPPPNEANELLPTMYALTHIHSDTSRILRAWIGFETPDRAFRQCGGIPEINKLDASGGAVWINDNPIAAPIWRHPGERRYLQPTWFTPANEIPYDDEEFFWTREPATILLQKGWNKLLARVPRGFPEQKWKFAFVPVRWVNGRWVEDESVQFSGDFPPASQVR